jgi:subtilisin-like proprotein convertase family protein
VFTNFLSNFSNWFNFNWNTLCLGNYLYQIQKLQMNCCYQNKKTNFILCLTVLFLSLCYKNVYSQTPVYCSAPGSNCSFFDQISNVKFSTLNNSSTCSGSGYADYTSAVAAPTINRGATVPLSVTIGPGGNDSAAVWIDYNQNGIFESSEYTFIGGSTASSDVTVTAGIKIPNNAMAGIARMRVRVKYYAADPPDNIPWTDANACTGYQYSETEDYNVNINATCNYPTIPTLSADTVLCGTGGSAVLSVTGGTLNEATTWVWYAGGCGSGAAVTTGTTLTVTPAVTTTYYVRGEGGCATESNCASVTVTVSSGPASPTIDSITPICINSTQLLNINPIAIFRGNYTVSSGTINLAVPDNTEDGVSSTLTVAANPLPAGAALESLEIKLNMTHPYPGDMIFNLKAPNGKILNLYKYGSGEYTGQSGGIPNAGWFNAITSSTATIPYSSVTSGYAYGSIATPGPFKADALNTTVSQSVVQNPAGFVSDAADFAEVLTTLSGDWTLAMADGGPNDLGILADWSIIIRYTLSTAAYPAVWSPSSTLFTDAAGTIPYDGTTPLFSVYAKPVLNTTYTAISVNTGCTSGPSTILVTVNNPITVTTQPTSITICEFGTAAFTAAANGTTPSYQWLVNNGSGTYTAITNNNNYNGATTSTLTVNGAPYSWNGYQYRCLITSTAPCLTFDTTQAAVFNINPTPALTLTALPLSKLLPGLSTTLSVGSNPSATNYIWYKNNIELPSVTTDQLNVTVDELGVYKVTVTDINGCVNTSSLLAVTDSVSGKLFVFPNPNVGQFRVSYYSLAGNTLPRTLLIYDAKGALVYNKTYTIGKPYDKMEVNFSGFSKGVYMINLLDVSGKRLAVGKVVVQ